MWKIDTTSMSVFWNFDCLYQYNSTETSHCIVFIFFQILRFQIGGAAYLRMQLIHGRLQYLPSNEWHFSSIPCRVELKDHFVTVKTLVYTFLGIQLFIPFTPSNTPFSLLHNSYDMSLENLVLDQQLFLQFIFFFILITSLLGIVSTR